MTDRDLLERAAKAAGMPLGNAQAGAWFYCDHGRCGAGLYRISGNLMEFWNAGADDGDALRLAVKLRMSVCVEADQTWICMQGASTTPVCFENHGDDDLAATRRAIVRAAAAMAGD